MQDSDQHLVLLGGGHSHALVLKRWAMKPNKRPGGLITLVSSAPTSLYSGMVPGLIAGTYTTEEININLPQLADQAGVAFIQAEANGIDPHKKLLNLQGRTALRYTLLSCNIGCITPPIPHAIAIKPLKPALTWIKEHDAEANNTEAPPFTVVGSGLAGVEVVFALRKRWPKRALRLQAKENQLIAAFRKALREAKIELTETEEPIAGPALNCTGSKGPDWLSEHTLPTDSNGRILTTSTLQVIDHPNLLATGDCAAIKDSPRPPSGVWAVRAAKPLARTIEALSKQQQPPKWRPQERALQLLGTSLPKQQAWAIWGQQRIGPMPWIWHWKQKIDRQFIAKFKTQKAMARGETASQEPMLCRGCAAKLPAEPLKEALTFANLKRLGHEPEDAQTIGNATNGQVVLQSVDGFPAVVSDPWMNGRITALHASSDLWACGGTVQSAQALITLPNVNESLQQMLLSQTLAGIQSALQEQGAELIGGHTLEARSSPPTPSSLGIQVGLVVQGGVEQGKPWQKRSLRRGDHLLISRPLGTGVLFAAEMTGDATPEAIAAAKQQMASSQHGLITSLRTLEELSGHAIHAATDITGFGLLGHLLEMLPQDATQRIELEALNIPALPQSLELLADGHASSLAPSNRKAWRALDRHNQESPAIDLKLGRMKPGGREAMAILELLVDPQTCGPLLVAVAPEASQELTSKHPEFRRIGRVL